MAKATASINSIESFLGTVQGISSEIRDSSSTVSDSVRGWQVQIGEETTRCQNLCDRISIEVYRLQSEISAIDERISSLESRLASIEPYKEYEWRDEDGNVHTERVPNPEYEAIRSQISELRTKRNSLSLQLSEIRRIQYEAESVKRRLEGASSGLEGIDGNIDRTLGEVDEYTVKAAKLLENIIGILSAYLSVSIGTGVSGGGSVGTGSGGAISSGGVTGAAAVNPASGTKTYVGADGTRVTPVDSSSGASSSGKYTDGVVYEGKVAFEHNKAKHTVDIKRKIYQYAPGIDLDYVRPDGRTNREAMLKGEAPIVFVQTKNGILQTKLDLHHVTQQETIGFPGAQFKQGTLAEIPVSSHKKYTKAIHMRYPAQNGIRRSFRVTKMADHTYRRSMDDKQFNAFRKQYWRTRALMGA